MHFRQHLRRLNYEGRYLNKQLIYHGVQQSKRLIMKRRHRIHLEYSIHQKKARATRNTSLTRCEWSIADEVAAHRGSFRRRKTKARKLFMASKFYVTALVPLASSRSVVGRRSFEGPPSKQNAVFIASIYIYTT